MIPEFNNDGYLPIGIHLASLEEFKERFVNIGVKRQLLFEGLEKLIFDLKSVGCNVIYIDGSYVTVKIQPNDIDVCWDDRFLNESIYDNLLIKFPEIIDFNPPRAKQKEKYNCDIFPAFLTEGSTGVYFIDFFQRVKNLNQKKGIIKLQIS